MNHRDNLETAFEYASYSSDPSTQVGAYIVGRKGQSVGGYNKFPIGVHSDFDDKKYKYANIVHAEVDAIMLAAKEGVKCRGATMYITWACCEHCARRIVAAGISTVVTSMSLYKKTQDHDKWKNSVLQGLEYLKNHEVEVLVLDEDEEFNFHEVRFNGTTI